MLGRVSSKNVSIGLQRRGVERERLNCFNSVVIQIQSPALPSPVGITLVKTPLIPPPLLNLVLNGLSLCRSLKNVLDCQHLHTAQVTKALIRTAAILTPRPGHPLLVSFHKSLECQKFWTTNLSPYLNLDLARG